MSQPEPLFDAAATLPQPCQAEGCASIRLAGQDGPVPGCEHERERAMGGTWKRPRGCLNAVPDPRYAELPF